MIIHCDAASLGKHTFIIGYKAFQDKHCAYKKIYARSVNEAELLSIPLKSGKCCKSALQNFLIKINKLFVSFR